MNDNNDLSEIENALRRLTPRAPSASCVERISEKLDAPAAPKGNIIRWVAPLFAAAACAAILLAAVNLTKPAANQIPAEKFAAAPAPANADASPKIAPNLDAPDAQIAPDALATPDAPVVLASATPHASQTEIPVRSELRSLEPLEIRRTADGNYYQPYRVRYKNTVRDTPQNGRHTAILRAVPAEEVHFVRLDFM